MTAEPVLPTMNPGTTRAHTGLSIPECSCPACHLEQLRRHAPALLRGCQPTLDLAAPIVPLEVYARAHGKTVAELRHNVSQREVRV
jgi:hypothetical protein